MLRPQVSDEMTAKMAPPRKCGDCGEREVSPVVLPVYRVELNHDGKSYPIEPADFAVFRCGACGVVVLDDDAERRLSEALRDAAGLLQPGAIRGHREALELEVGQLAPLLGVSEAALGRWEEGAQIQPRALDLWMRVFFHVPEARVYTGGLARSDRGAAASPIASEPRS